MNRILSMLRSPGAMMVALVAILAAQGEHTAQVIAYFSHSGGEPLAYAFAFAIEVAVLLFVMNGHKRISYGFAVATFFTNVIYYAIGGVDLLSIAIAPVLLLSVLPPAAIVGYSHTIADKPISDDANTDGTPAPRRYFWRFWRKPVETPTTNIQPIASAKTPVAIPVGTLGHSSDVAPTQQEAASAPEQPQDAPQAKATPEQRRVLIAEWQLQNTQQVMDAFGIGKRTADADLAAVRKNVMHTNGVAK